MTHSLARLALEDGTVLRGTAFGGRGEVDGEVVFNTSMTGYQEILTDPSYRGQIVTMTYPEIGNYGVNDEDVESHKPHLAGFVVRELSRIASNFRSQGTLDEYLKRHGIIGMAGIDTRALVRRIRIHGALKGILSTRAESEVNDAELVKLAKSSPGLVGRDLVSEVLPDATRDWTESLNSWSRLPGGEATQAPAANPSRSSPHVVAMDFGMKWNIARHLRELGFQVTIVPGTTSAQEIRGLKPDGLFLSNGPGDPEPVQFAVDTIRELIDELPTFGICLGHQLLALACGAKTFKLKFGHRGSNQPVINYDSGRVEITSQNHGFAVDEKSLPDNLEVTHRNLNDDTVAGLRHKTLPVFSVQYHPEASAGPHDSRYLFEQFQQSIESAGQPR